MSIVLYRTFLAVARMLLRRGLCTFADFIGESKDPKDDILREETENECALARAILRRMVEVNKLTSEELQEDLDEQITKEDSNDQPTNGLKRKRCEVSGQCS